MLSKKLHKGERGIFTDRSQQNSQNPQPYDRTDRQTVFHGLLGEVMFGFCLLTAILRVV